MENSADRGDGAGRVLGSAVTEGAASAKDMLTLIADVRERVHKAFALELEHEVVVWNA